MHHVVTVRQFLLHARAEQTRNVGTRAHYGHVAADGQAPGRNTRSASCFHLRRRRANAQVVQRIRKAAHKLVRRRGLETLESTFDFATKSPYSDEDFGLRISRP